MQWTRLSDARPPENVTVLIRVGDGTFAGKLVRGQFLEGGADSWLILPDGEDDVGFLLATESCLWSHLPV